MSNITIVVMTNMMNEFRSAIGRSKYDFSEVIFEEISDSWAYEWTFQGRYIYGAKMNAINYFLEKYKSNVLFLD